MRPLLLLLSLVLACGSVPPADYPTVAPPDEISPALGAGDVLDVTIFNGTKESKATYRLDNSGIISVQYIGEVETLGRTSDQLRDEIRTRLADGYLRDPIVSITVTEVNSRKISVSGQVNKAGTLRYTPGMTIIDAIAQSGDFTPMAKKNAVQVIRVVDGVEQAYTIPVEAIREGKRPNFPMATGDRLFVPERIF
ncbi:MAG: polysaccharide biosynthesis/export family protein [Kofleriaceae bacterium]